MIKVITIVFIYYLLGMINLFVIYTHDRHNDEFNQILDIHDNIQVAFAVLLWPLLILIEVLYLIFVWIPAKTAKGALIIITAIIYTIKALFDKDN